MTDNQTLKSKIMQKLHESRAGGASKPATSKSKTKTKSTARAAQAAQAATDDDAPYKAFAQDRPGIGIENEDPFSLLQQRVRVAKELMEDTEEYIQRKLWYDIYRESDEFQAFQQWDAKHKTTPEYQKHLKLKNELSLMKKKLMK